MSKNSQKFITKTKCSFPNKFTIRTSYKFKNWKYVLFLNFVTQKGFSKKLQPIQRGPIQIIDKTTDVTYRIIDSNKKEIVQHRKNFLPYYPKEYVLRELAQLYSFTGLKVVHDNSDNNQKPNK